MTDYNRTAILKDENFGLYLAVSVGSAAFLLSCVVFITIVVSVIFVKGNVKVKRGSSQAREIPPPTVEYEEIGLNQQDSSIVHTEDNAAYSHVSMDVD